MTDPRALLEAYAEETDFYRGDLLDDREHEAPAAFAALRAVLDLHPRSVLTAGVMLDLFGPDRCAYCHLGAPIRRYRDDINGREMDAHDHTDPEPACYTCAGPEEETSQPWPCPTVRAITTALEAS